MDGAARARDLDVVAADVAALLDGLDDRERVAVLATVLAGDAVRSGKPMIYVALLREVVLARVERLGR